MESLSLVLDVLDRAEEVARNSEPLDATAEARRLLREHPETSAKVAEVEALIRNELRISRKATEDIW